MSAELSPAPRLLRRNEHQNPDCGRQLVNWLFSGALTHDSGAMAAWRELDGCVSPTGASAVPPSNPAPSST